nr:MAG TPA: hypothetical protein [Caudoviricetes sp.]
MVNRRRKRWEGFRAKAESAACPGCHEGDTSSPQRMRHYWPGAGQPGTARPTNHSLVTDGCGLKDTERFAAISSCIYTADQKTT